MTVPSFNEALEYAKKRKIVLPQEFYDPKNKDRHGELMTISNLAGLSQIQAVTDDLMTALENGETFEQWQQRALSTEGVGGLPPGRTETVFRNYMQSAYNSGRWEQFERNKKAVPYLMFSAINDARTTDICRNRNGIVRPVDDDFWKSNSPMLHHRCRSTLIALTKSQAQNRSGADTGLNQKPPKEPVADGWGRRPTPQEQAETLTLLLADKLKNYPKSAWPRITDVFMELWAMLGKLIRSLIPL